MASHHAPAANLERSRNAPILASSVASSAAANSKTGAEAVESLISGGGFVGNVHDACPGYTAKQGKEKGQLIFDAAFESGKNEGCSTKTNSSWLINYCLCIMVPVVRSSLP